MEGLSWIWEAVSSVIGLGGILAAIYIAIRYGDVRAAHELMEFENEKSAKAQRIALQALVAETKRMTELAKYNTATIKEKAWAAKMPIATLESALFFAQSNLLGGREDVDSAIESSCIPPAMTVLTEVYAINALVDQSLLHKKSPRAKTDRDEALKRIPEKLGTLECSLEELTTALEQASTAASA